MLFIGYSLGDINIRYLLYKMHVQWAKSEWVRVRPRWYFFLSSPNPIQEAILENRGIKAIVSQKDDPAEGLKDFLYGLVKDAFLTS